MLDDGPERRDKSPLKAPGVLVSALVPLGDLAASGLDGKAIGEVTRSTYRLGLDPVHASRAIRSAGVQDVNGASKILEALAMGEGAPAPGDTMVPWALGDDTGGHRAFNELGVFTPANPPLIPVRGVDGAEGLLVHQGLAYVLGMCPAGAVGAGIDARSLVAVVRAATGLDLAASDLDTLAARLVRETLALGPGLPPDASQVTKDLRERFQ